MLRFPDSSQHFKPKPQILLLIEHLTFKYPVYTEEFQENNSNFLKDPLESP